MSILIKGIDMPKDGELLCIVVNPDGKVYIDLDLECKQVATAVPVPPHGRLIDADAFIRNIAKLERVDPITAAGIIAFVNAALTIIPAEEGE